MYKLHGQNEIEKGASKQAASELNVEYIYHELSVPGEIVLLLVLASLICHILDTRRMVGRIWSSLVTSYTLLEDYHVDGNVVFLKHIYN